MEKFLFSNILQPFDDNDTHNLCKFGDGALGFGSRIKEISKNDNAILKVLTIPSGSKKSILSDLKLFGINEAFLFADNVDKVFEEIKNQAFREFGYSND